MQMSTVCPIPAGCAILRDIRCWHGGTPCVGDTPRAMPSCNFASPWFSPGQASHVMPREVHAQLSERGRQLTRHIVADEGEVCHCLLHIHGVVSPVKSLVKITDAVRGCCISALKELSLGWKEGGSRVTNHRLSLERIQELRAGRPGAL